MGATEPSMFPIIIYQGHANGCKLDVLKCSSSSCSYWWRQLHHVTPLFIDVTLVSWRYFYLFFLLILLVRGPPLTCDVQILTYKDGPRTERITIFIMTADPWHVYSYKRKELSKTYLILNWKNPFRLHGLYTNISALHGLIFTMWHL